MTAARALSKDGREDCEMVRFWGEAKSVRLCSKHSLALGEAPIGRQSHGLRGQEPRERTGSAHPHIQSPAPRAKAWSQTYSYRWPPGPRLDQRGRAGPPAGAWQWGGSGASSASCL